MKKLFAVVVLLFAASTIANANAVTGSLPFVFVDVVGTGGTNLATITMLTATDSLTEGPGTGDFAVIPVLTSFGPMSLNEATIGTGGGFMVSNTTWGIFTATSATLITRTPAFLNVDMHGTFTPGPGLAPLTASPADAHVTFNMTGPALSGAFTLDTTAVPEAMGLGIMCCLMLGGVAWYQKGWKNI